MAGDRPEALILELGQEFVPGTYLIWVKLCGECDGTGRKVDMSQPAGVPPLSICQLCKGTGKWAAIIIGPETRKTEEDYGK